MTWHVTLQHSVQQGLLVMTVSMLLLANTCNLFSFSSGMSCSLTRRTYLFLFLRILDANPKFVVLLYLLIPFLCITGVLCYSHFIRWASVCAGDILNYTFRINCSGILMGYEAIETSVALWPNQQAAACGFLSFDT